MRYLDLSLEANEAVYAVLFKENGVWYCSSTGPVVVGKGAQTVRIDDKHGTRRFRLGF